MIMVLNLIKDLKLSALKALVEVPVRCLQSELIFK